MVVDLRSTGHLTINPQSIICFSVSICKGLDITFLSCSPYSKIRTSTISQWSHISCPNWPKKGSTCTETASLHIKFLTLCHMISPFWINQQCCNISNCWKQSNIGRMKNLVSSLGSWLRSHCAVVSNYDGANAANVATKVICFSVNHAISRSRALSNLEGATALWLRAQKFNNRCEILHIY